MFKEPEEVVLGVEVLSRDLRGRKITKTRKESYQYIPFLKMLARLLSQYDIRAQVRFLNCFVINFAFILNFPII